MPTQEEIIRNAMSILGQRKSKRKAAASRANGKLGGRPKALEKRRMTLLKKSQK